MLQQGLSSTLYFIRVIYKDILKDFLQWGDAAHENLYHSVQTTGDHETLLLIMMDSSLVAFFFWLHHPHTQGASFTLCH